MWRPRIILILFLFLSLSVAAQDDPSIDFNISLNINVPDHDRVLRENYDGLPAARLRIRKAQSEKFKYGFSAELLQVRTINIPATPLNAQRASLYLLDGEINYILLQHNNFRLEPALQVGYTIINYDKGASGGGSFNIGPGLNLFFQTDENYGVELSGTYSTTYTTFAPDNTVDNVNSMRFFIIRLGVTFSLRKKLLLNN